MTLLKGSAFIYATSSVEALESSAKARGMAHQVPKSFFKLNGRELTAQNRRYQSTVNTKSKTVVLASGNSRRYYIRSPRTFSLNYTYLPGPDAMTVDGKAARDYLYTIASTGNNASIEYLPDYTSDQSDFDYKTARVIVKGYKESVIRRDEGNGCYYYDLSIQFEEL
tara:strand:- start:305 stop:805 length:501 start_codon:yes stop_codon:yes gene_type:complete